MGWNTSAGTRIRKYTGLFLSQAIQFFSIYFMFARITPPCLKSKIAPA